MNSAALAHFLQGSKKGLPIVVGYIPIAIAFGVLARQADLPILPTILMSILVYAGASQFMAVNMLVSGTAGLEIVIATFILNLRHLIMSLSMMNILRHVPKSWKSLLSFGVTDESFAVASLEASENGSRLHHFFVLGLFTTAYASWIAGTWAGAVLYQLIPASISDSMSIALYAMFIGLLVPAAQKAWRVGLIAAASMILCTLFNQVFSTGWSVVLATIFGSVAGIFVYEKEEEQ
ncbi:AzlC family ABC transporter permease [Paenactinomyces guangxiensis]|uniref:AzlC family ABC transporter permease n=1 Tax=Paenactinomyces guangxiensis TaxID=1490290 RepID=A0A7W1WMW7_9BACL|nr:AzlC family ABC transporter permease [Paenactinomyces guangxiensis]MBA4492731.1 AzlC family ABC transporter permease [Paenactinomyces guangxiensis]MBH8590420.1 AzlC family ABC transporter permease [Paenactinomyces guangxiensis]